MFMGTDKQASLVYTDNSQELTSALETLGTLGWPHDPATPYKPQTNGIGVISSSNAHTSLISVGIVVVKKLKLSHWDTPKH